MATVINFILQDRRSTKVIMAVYIMVTQLGFMADKGTRNAIFSLRTLMERVIKVQKDLYQCFIDYSNASDKVRHSDMFDILPRYNCDGKNLKT